MLLFNLLLMGCLSVHSNKVNTNFLEEYQQSGSMCLDALSLNLAKSDCVSVSHETSHDQVVHFIRCAKSAKDSEDNTWNNLVFMVVNTKLSIQSPDLLQGKEVMCADASLTVAVTQRDNYLGPLPKKRPAF